MKKAQQPFGFLHSTAYVKAMTCLLLTAGGTLPTMTASAVAPSVKAVQQGTVTVKGVVKDAKGEPIIGATVVEKGNTKNGTITDLNGHYSLNVKR